MSTASSIYTGLAPIDIISFVTAMDIASRPLACVCTFHHESTHVLAVISPLRLQLTYRLAISILPQFSDVSVAIMVDSNPEV